MNHNTPNPQSRPSLPNSLPNESDDILRKKRGLLQKSESSVAFAALDRDSAISKTSYTLPRSHSVQPDITLTLSTARSSEVSTSSDAASLGAGERVYYHVTVMLTLSENVVVPHDVHCIRVLPGTYLLVAAEVRLYINSYKIISICIQCF